MEGDIKASVWLLEKRDSLPTPTAEEEVPPTEEESWDEGDKQMLDAYIRTSIQLGIVDDESEYGLVKKVDTYVSNPGQEEENSQ